MPAAATTTHWYYLSGVDVPTADAGTRINPFVGCFDHGLEIAIGQFLFGQIGARAGDAGVGHAAFAWGLAIMSSMRFNTPFATSATARSMARSKAKLSAEPWLFTTTPRNPINAAPL